MKFYFENTCSNNAFRGKPRTTLPEVLKQDLERYYNNTEPQHRDHNYTKKIKLNKSEDLEKLREIAENREDWKKLINGITNTREASTSVDGEATPF